MSDLLPGSTELYSVGSNEKAWLRSIFASRDVINDFLSQLTIGAKYPTSYPFLGDFLWPFIDFYCENPIGTKRYHYSISSDGTYLWFIGISPDEQNIKYFMGFDFEYNRFLVSSHFIPGEGDSFDLGTPDPSFGFRWRDIALSRHFYLGNTDSLPEASELYRGAMIRIEGGEGVADKLYCCMKKADDTYAWIQVASG